MNSNGTPPRGNGNEPSLEEMTSPLYAEMVRRKGETTGAKKLG